MRDVAKHNARLLDEAPGALPQLYWMLASLLVLCAGCLPSGEDSWGHYQGGGHYPARTPCMSPDGLVIVFSSPRTGSGDIYQIDRDGSQLVRLTNSPDFETDPLFSPDGTAIAFAREVKSR